MMVRFPREIRDRFVVALLAGSVTLAPTQVLAAQRSAGCTRSTSTGCPFFRPSPPVNQGGYS